jgi:phosphatidylserine decarboxylase
MVRDGIWYGSALLLLGAGAAYLGGPVWAVPEVALAAFVLYFFRDPERVIPSGDGVVSPADGRIVDLSKFQIEGRPVWKISIFLSIFNVHVNRAPVSGIVKKQVYTPGRFRIASQAEASVENEQNTVTLQQEGDSVVVKQIAGAIARRIVFSKKIGDRVERGERIGLIKFGSRVDLFLPLDYAPAVAVGDRVRGGSSWIARPARDRAATLPAPSLAGDRPMEPAAGR